MFALADAGFQISLQTVKRLVGTKHLRILEIGWGQAGCQLSTLCASWRQHHRSVISDFKRTYTYVDMYI